MSFRFAISSELAQVTKYNTGIWRRSGCKNWLKLISRSQGRGIEIGYQTSLGQSANRNDTVT